MEVLMKKYSPTYTNDCIIYWPSFTGGVGFLCFCGMILLLYLSCIILFLCEQNIANKTVLITAIAAVLLLVWLILALRMTVRSMFCCITITSENFSIVNTVTATHTNIMWEQVSRIEFHLEGYRGRKQYRVYLKTDAQAQYIAIPISMVDEEKLSNLIPSELLISRPYSV